jgi:hypothetical protein
MVKLAPKGHSVIRMTGGSGSEEEGAESEGAVAPPVAPPASPPAPSTAEPPQLSPAAKPLNLFADSTVPCFFR